MPKTHYKLDRSAVRRGEERDRDAERETAERHGFYQYKRFVLVPIGQIEHQPVWHPGRIEGILDAIDRGKPLPPIRADKDRGKYAITDGIHRYNASLQRGFTHVPVLETVTVDAPEMYIPPVPEKPVLRPGTYVKLTEKPHRATSLWARVEEYLGPYREREDVIRHVYSLDGIVRGRVDFVGDWRDDKFDPEAGRPPRDVLQAFEAEDARVRASAPRVALRFASARKTAARPIRLPTREIKTLAKRLAQRLYQYGLPKPGRVTAQEYLPLTNVKGDEVVVEILLTGTPGRNRDPFSNELLNGGFLKRRPKGPLMRVFVNPHLDPRTFEMRPRRVVENELYRLLAHELTHAADIWSGKGSVGDLSGSKDDIKKHHHNHPAEVKALMRDVVTHLDDGDTVREFMGYGMDFNTALREALKDTKWPDIAPYLNSRNKKTILKGVYTFLQDQGLDEVVSRVARKKASSYPVTSVATVIFNESDQALILRRGSTAPWMPGKWNLPGGTVDSGEGLRQAALREAVEETSLRVRSASPLAVLDHAPEEWAAAFFVSGPGEWSGNVKLDYENDAYAWISASEIGGYSFIPTAKEALTKAFRSRSLSRVASRYAYQGSHTPPSDGVQAHDLGSGTHVPADILSHPEWYTGYRSYLREFWNTLLKAQGNPNARIVIYRALPQEYSTFSKGDWVSPSLRYAKDHAAGEDGWHIIKATVPARSLRFAGDDLMEWGYWGSSLDGKTTARVASRWEPSTIGEVEGWAEDFAYENNYTLGTCDLNRGDCDMMSNVFADWFEDQTGVALEIWAGQGFVPPLGKDANALWLTLSGDTAHERGVEKPLSHVVVKMGDWVVDLTGRQFGGLYSDPVYPFSVFKRNWSEVRRVRRADRKLNAIRKMLLQMNEDTRVASRYRAAGEFHRVIAQIEDETGLDATFEAQADSIRIELSKDGKKAGYFRASTVNPDSFQWKNAPSDCKEAWEKMGKPPIWVVRGAEWFDASLRGKGYGKILYKALFFYIASKKGVVGPNSCSGGNTSADAEKVWKSLRSMYPTKGPLIDLRKGVR